MSVMKCTNCGGTALFNCHLNIGNKTCEIGSATTPYACKQCGHIEWFLDDDRIKLQIQSEKQESEYQREMDAYNNEKTALAQQINSLEVIIRDDSKTVRTVNEAKDKLEQLQSRMRKLSKPVRPR